MRPYTQHTKAEQFDRKNQALTKLRAKLERYEAQMDHLIEKIGSLRNRIHVLENRTNQLLNEGLEETVQPQA